MTATRTISKGKLQQQVDGAESTNVKQSQVLAKDQLHGGISETSELVPYDEHLLERVRVQWYFGDWSSLAKLERHIVQHHPDRARLALMVAAAHMQLQQVENGRHFLRLAQDYGCNKKLIAQVLISGVHNSLGRASIANDQQQRAFQHFERAITLGAPGSDARLLSQARAREQFTQLHATPAGTNIRADESNRSKIVQLGFTPHPCPLLPPGFVADFFLPENQTSALVELTTVSNDLITDVKMPDIHSTAVVHRDKRYYFAHFENDYIPSTIRDSGKFYEAPFLNLLARLHQPRKIIVDGGANLGNHSIFFAGVMKAQVIAFEPQPHNHLLLCANRSLNQLDQAIDIRAKALGAQAGTVSLHLSQENNYGTFTSNEKTSLASQNENTLMSAAYEFAVEVTTLDAELAAEIDNISILKLDIEGMELAALQGAQQILRHGKPLVAVECFNQLLFRTIKDFLVDFDYFLIDSANATPTFIFLNKGNAFHIEALAAHLERVSIDKLNTTRATNEGSDHFWNTH